MSAATFNCSQYTGFPLRAAPSRSPIACDRTMRPLGWEMQVDKSDALSLMMSCSWGQLSCSPPQPSGACWYPTMLQPNRELVLRDSSLHLCGWIIYHPTLVLVVMKSNIYVYTYNIRSCTHTFANLGEIWTRFAHKFSNCRVCLHERKTYKQLFSCRFDQINEV